MKQVIKTYWPLVALMIGMLVLMFPYELFGRPVPYGVVKAAAPRITVHMLVTVFSASLFLFAFLQVVRGERAKTEQVQTKKQRRLAREAGLLGVSCLVLGLLASVLPHMSELSYSWEQGLLLGASVVSAVGVVCLSVMERAQAWLYWVRLKRDSELDERQLHDRLFVIQRAYRCSIVVLLILLLLGVMFTDIIVSTLADTQRNNGSIYFPWQPMINSILAVIFMPGIVAAFTAKRS